MISAARYRERDVNALCHILQTCLARWDWAVSRLMLADKACKKLAMTVDAIEAWYSADQFRHLCDQDEIDRQAVHLHVDYCYFRMGR